MHEFCNYCIYPFVQREHFLYSHKCCSQPFKAFHFRYNFNLHNYFTQQPCAKYLFLTTSIASNLLDQEGFSCITQRGKSTKYHELHLKWNLHLLRINFHSLFSNKNRTTNTYTHNPMFKPKYLKQQIEKSSGMSKIYKSVQAICYFFPLGQFLYWPLHLFQNSKG